MLTYDSGRVMCVYVRTCTHTHTHTPPLSPPGQLHVFSQPLFQAPPSWPLLVLGFSSVKLSREETTTLLTMSCDLNYGLLSLAFPAGWTGVC